MNQLKTPLLQSFQERINATLEQLRKLKQDRESQSSAEQESPNKGGTEPPVGST